MSRLLLIAWLPLLACSDPSLQVELQVPVAYREQLKSASLSVVVPPVGEPFVCDDIAFGAIDDDQVRANTVEELLLRDGSSGRLEAIPRKGDKILLARGFDQEGEQIIAGCTQVGLIEGDQSTTINGEPVTIATIPAFNPADVPGRSTAVRVSDVNGEPVAGIEVRWTRTAPGAAAENDSAATDLDGLVLVEVKPPPLPGPVAVDVNARWARSEPPVIVGFRNPDLLFSDSLPNADENAFRNPDEIYQVGRVGPMGELGLAAIGNADATPTRQVYLAYYDPAISSFRTLVSDALPASALSLGLISGSQRDRIFTASTNAAIEVLPDGSLVPVPSSQAIPLVRRFLPLGNCVDPNEVQSLLAVFLDGSSAVIAGNGQVQPSPFSTPNAPGVPLASGCLTSDGGLHRAVVYADADAVKIVAQLDVPRVAQLGVVPAGIGFSQSTASEPALLLATTLGVEGTDIARFRILAIGDDLLEVELVTSDATPTFAQSTSSGDFDGDGLNDVAAVLVFGDTAEATDYRIYVSLGLEAATGRVAGVSGGKDGQRPRIFIRDFDSDGHDDIMVGSNGFFDIFSMGAM